MKIFRFIIGTTFLLIALTFGIKVTAQTNNTQIDTIPNDSYDNFKNKPNYSPSYVVIKSKESGKILFEQNIENGKCGECYDKITSKADSCFKKKNYIDAVALYTSAFKLNDNKGKVKHRLNAACGLVNLNDFENAFENLNRVVFGAKFHNIYEITSNDCFKPLQQDARWAKLIEGINKNLDEVQKKLKAETPIEQ